MASKSEELNKILLGLRTGSPDVEACALISEDGLMLASALPQEYEEVRIAGMSSTLLSLGARAATELERGDIEQVIIRGDEGFVVMVAAASGTMLLVLTTKAAKLGLTFLDASRAVQGIKTIL